MRLLNLVHYLLRHPAWLVCCFLVLAAGAGRIVDIDHPLHYFFGWGESGRYLMGYFECGGYVLLGCGTVILIACLGRCARTRFLK